MYVLSNGSLRRVHSVQITHNPPLLLHTHLYMVTVCCIWVHRNASHRRVAFVATPSLSPEARRCSKKYLGHCPGI